MRSSTWRLEDLRNVILNLGFVGENLHTRQIFDCKKMFDQYPNASVSMTVTPPEGEPYPGTIERDGDMVIWDVRDSDLVAEGDGEIQLVFTQEPHIARSYNARTHICRSQVPTGSIPSGLDDYITRADQLLDEVKDTFPAGGTTGQVLAKKSDTDYDTEWVDQGGGTEDYDELENRPQIGGVTLTGNKTLHELGAASEGDVDAKYTKPAGGIPASDIADGVIPDPEDLIDDEAGEGDTDKVWSADKSHALLTEINSKQDSPSTAGTAGQVLTSDGNGGASWENPTGGHEIPSGGTTGQLLGKASNTSYDVEWKTVSGSGVVDDELSESSTNPVQNKLITKAINKTFVFLEEPEWTYGYYDSNLEYVATPTITSAKAGEITIPASDHIRKLYVCAYAQQPGWCGLKDASGNIISKWGQTAETTIIIPQDATKLIVSHASNHNVKFYAAYKNDDFIKAHDANFYGDNQYLGIENFRYEWFTAYHDSNLSRVTASGFTAWEIVVSMCESIKCTAYTKTNSFSGFVDKDGNVLETWQQEMTEVTKTVPKGAYKLCISIQNNTGRYLAFSGKIKSLYENLADDKKSIDVMQNMLDGGTIKKILPTFSHGYYDSSLEFVSTELTTLDAAEVDVSDYTNIMSINLTAYAQTNAYCGFVDANDNILEKWQQNGSVSKAIPVWASKLLISHATNKNITFALTVSTGGIVDLVSKDITIGGDEYSSSKTYKFGEYSRTGDILLRNIVPITSGETLDLTKWEKTRILDDLEVAFPSFPMMKLNGLKWKACGDSLTSDSTGWSYVPVVADLLGIGSNDYTNYGSAGAKMLACGTEASNDPGTADIVTLFAGTNDFYSSNGATAIATFKSDTESVIDRFKNGGYSARLYMITPIPRFDHLTNSLGLTMADYVDVINEVCAAKNIPVLNLYDMIRLTPTNQTKYLVDSLHPTTYGKYRIARMIAQFISDNERMYRMIQTFGS